MHQMGLIILCSKRIIVPIVFQLNIRSYSIIILSHLYVWSVHATVLKTVCAAAESATFER
jgi:hypothetical protein